MKHLVETFHTPEFLRKGTVGIKVMQYLLLKQLYK